MFIQTRKHLTRNCSSSEGFLTRAYSKGTTMCSSPQLNFQYHSKELKTRLLYILLTISCTFFIAFINMDYFLYKISLPVMMPSARAYESTSDTSGMVIQSMYSESTLPFIFTEVFEAFFSYITLSSYITFFITLPFIYYHFYKFILPGLSYTESLFIKICFNISFCLLILAHLITYYFILPYAISFFLNFASNYSTEITPPVFKGEDMSFGHNINNGLKLTFLGRISPWISFLINIFTGISFLFQLPLFLFVTFIIVSVSRRSINKSTTYPNNLNSKNLNLLQSQLGNSPSHFNQDLNQKLIEEPIYANAKGNEVHIIDKSAIPTQFIRKMLFFILLLLTAIFSPPDLYSQFFMLIPLIFIIELFLFLIFIYYALLEYET